MELFLDNSILSASHFLSKSDLLLVLIKSQVDPRCMNTNEENNWIGTLPPNISLQANLIFNPIKSVLRRYQIISI